MTYTEMSLGAFLNATYIGYEKSTVEKLKEIEEYQLGRKPARVRIDGGARDGTILRLNPAVFQRKAVSVFQATGEMQEDGRPAFKTVDIQADEPSIYHFKANNAACTEIIDHERIVGFVSADNYSSDTWDNLFLLDDGTNFSSKVRGAKKLTVLLDCDLPTSTPFKKRSKAELEAAKAEIKKFVDQLGQTVEVGDTVMFTLKEYSSQCMTGAGIAFGTVSRYFPSGGLSVTTFSGAEVRIMAPYKDVMVKVDNKLSQRIAAKKLDA